MLRRLQIMSSRRFSLVLFFTLLQFTGASTLSAQCSGSVSADYHPENATVIVTATSGSSECSNPGINASVQGYNFVSTDTCPTLDGCTKQFVFPTACFVPGPHTVTGVFFCE